MLDKGSGSGTFFMFIDAEYGEQYVESSSKTLNNWYHCVGTYDGNSIKIYINGVQEGSVAQNGSMNNVSTNLYFGTQPDHVGGYYHGYLDEIGIWADDLTSTNIATLYNSGAGLTYPFSTSAPAAPVATGATNITSSGFTANWNSVSTATSYRLDVSTSSSFSHFVSGYNNLTVTGISQSVTGLSASTTYYYRIRAVNSYGTSGNSNSITATTSAAGTAPGAPTATSATSITSSGFTANWGTVSGATSYRLDVSTSSSFSNFVSGYNNLTVTGISQSVAGLSASTSYYYRVRAVNNYGASGNSNTITATTSAAGGGDTYWLPVPGAGIYYERNVGIGTSQPSERLEVSGGGIQLNGNYGIGFGDEIPYDGNVLHDGAKFYFDYNFFGTNLDAFVIEKTDGNQTTPDGGIVFTNKGNDNIRKAALVIKGTGNVGIGTINPDATLTVNGNIKAERIDVVSDVPSSDHVFRTDYPLMSLKELDEFIKANRHLPEVPTAEEFQENGYSVGEMDDLLLRKIEELTLYIIDQNKIIYDLQERIKEIENK